MAKKELTNEDVDLIAVIHGIPLKFLNANTLKKEGLNYQPLISKLKEAKITQFKNKLREEYNNGW